MKKTALIAMVFAFALTSCKKDIFGNKKEKPVPLTAPTTVKSPSVGDESATFGTNKLIGVYDHTTGGREIQIAPDFSVGGTVSLSKLKNLYFVIKKDSTEIYRSSKRPTVSSTNPTNNWITLQKGGKYSTWLYCDIDSGAIGTIITKSHTQFQAVDTSGWMDEVTGQTITVQLYKSSPTVTSIGNSTKVANGNFVVLNTTKIQSSVIDPTAIKQTSYQFTFSNNSGAGVMRFDSLRVFFNGDDLTGKCALVDDAGMTVTSMSQNSANKILHVVAITGEGEMVIQAADEGDITIKGLVHGFGGDSVVSDVATVIALKDAAAVPAGYTYLNRGTSGWNAKLYNSWLASSSAKPVSFAWSPMRYQPHDANYGSPTPDWYNSFGISFTATSFIIHS